MEKACIAATATYLFKESKRDVDVEDLDSNLDGSAVGKTRN